MDEWMKMRISILFLIESCYNGNDLLKGSNIYKNCNRKY